MTLARHSSTHRPGVVAWLAAGALLVACGCSEQKLPPALREARITGSASDPAVELRPEWHPGHLYELTLQLDQSTTVRNRNTDDDFDQDIQLRLDFNGGVDESPKGNGQSWLALQLTGFLFSLFRDDIPLVHYNTRSKVALLADDQRTTEVLDKLVGARWNYSIAPDASVPSASMDTNGPVGKVFDPDIKLTGVNAVRRLFNPHFFRPFLEFNFLPVAPVRIGASWPVERLLNAGTVGTVEFKGKCTFRGWQMTGGKNCARIEMEGDLLPLRNLAGRAGRVVRGSSELEKGTLTGVIWFDPDQKLPLQSVTELSMVTAVYSRSKRPPTSPPAPRDAGSTNGPVVQLSTNAPVTKLTVPLGQKFRLRIQDIGEMAKAPTGSLPPGQTTTNTPAAPTPNP